VSLPAILRREPEVDIQDARHQLEAVVDSSSQTIGLVRRPPSEPEIERARSRASRGGKRLSWAELVEQVTSCS